jgi:hypothetical protein
MIALMSFNDRSDLTSTIAKSVAASPVSTGIKGAVRDQIAGTMVEIFGT